MIFILYWMMEETRGDKDRWISVQWPGLPRVGDHVIWTDPLLNPGWVGHDLVVTRVNWYPDKEASWACEVVVREDV